MCNQAKDIGEMVGKNLPAASADTVPWRLCGEKTEAATSSNVLPFPGSVCTTGPRRFTRKHCNGLLKGHFGSESARPVLLRGIPFCVRLIRTRAALPTVQCNQTQTNIINIQTQDRNTRRRQRTYMGEARRDILLQSLAPWYCMDHPTIPFVATLRLDTCFVLPLIRLHLQTCKMSCTNNTPLVTNRLESE